MEQGVVQRIDEAEFRRVVSHFPSGVTIVTAEDGGVHYGATISAMSSLCADPPMVLVCLNQRLGTAVAIRAARRFTVNILGEDQHDLARTFAAQGSDKFQGVSMAESDYGPVLSDVLASLSCRLIDELPGGTHRIFIGEVVGALTGTGSALSYFKGQFGRFVPHNEVR